MKTTNIEDKIAFFKEKLEISKKVKLRILPDDPYADLKHKAMDNRIRIYQEELEKLQAEDLKNWMN